MLTLTEINYCDDIKSEIDEYNTNFEKTEINTIDFRTDYNIISSHKVYNTHKPEKLNNSIFHQNNEIDTNIFVLDKDNNTFKSLDNLNMFYDSSDEEINMFESFYSLSKDSLTKIKTYKEYENNEQNSISE